MYHYTNTSLDIVLTGVHAYAAQMVFIAYCIDSMCLVGT